MILNIMDDLEKISDNFREFVSNHPETLVIIFVLGIAIFYIVYGMLNKNN